MPRPARTVRAQALTRKKVVLFVDLYKVLSPALKSLPANSIFLKLDCPPAAASCLPEYRAGTGRLVRGDRGDRGGGLGGALLVAYSRNDVAHELFGCRNVALKVLLDESLPEPDLLVRNNANNII